MQVNVRFGRFFRAVASGYALLVANTIYVLASVPLALHFLPTREFGLWALAMQLTGYLQLIDLGMSASVSRHLIDHKDQRLTGGYGSMIKTGFVVLLAQGALVLVAAILLIHFGTGLLRLDGDLEHAFRTVMFIQCGIVAVDFPARLFGHMLVAHQRTDIANYAQIGMFAITYASLWLFFSQGFGVFSLAWANLVGWAGITGSNLIACFSLSFFPSVGKWGRVSWQQFRDLFGYGKDVFWIAVGTQMINASQSIVITRALGLDAAAVWSVCTRTFTLANQLVWRPFDFSYPMLSEMVAREERERLLRRFRGLVTVSTSFAAVGAVMFATCNQPFVALWTRQSIGWAIQNDVLLGVWMILLALVHCHCGFVLISKRIRFMRYIYFVEGTIFLLCGTYAARYYGFAGLVTTSLACTAIFSLSYGIYRTKAEFELSLYEVAWNWIRPSAEVLFFVATLGGICYWLANDLTPILQLLVFGGVVGTAGAILLIRRGLGNELRDELRHRAPPSVSRYLNKVLPGPVSSPPAETFFK